MVLNIKNLLSFQDFFDHYSSEPFKEEQLVLFQYLLNCSVRDPYYIALHVFTDLPLQGHSVKSLKHFFSFSKHIYSMVEHSLKREEE